jgi:hypothetical protein
MSDTSGYGTPPTPEQNRADYLAAHPEAQPVSGQAAADAVAQNLGAAAPGSGVTDADLGAQLAAGGAQQGFVDPQAAEYQASMDDLMAQVKALGQQVQLLQARDEQRTAASIAQLGEPILIRYAKGVADKLRAHMASHPALGAEHYGQAIADADSLARAATDAISKGGNDMGQVHNLAYRLDRFFTRTHPRAKTGLSNPDHSSAEYDLDQVVNEANRLAPGGSQPALTGRVV